jgi:MazG family protein
MARLRAPDGCPWDREQTHQTLARCLIDECSELLDTIDRNDLPHMREELGDVLIQVVFHAQLAAERGDFDFDDVARDINTKLIRRHPHVFGDVEVANAGEVLANWDEIKSGEAGREPGVFGEVPENLPALLYARKVQRRAASAGLLDRPAGEPDPGERDAAFHDVGEQLFAVVDEARRLRVDPELALRAASHRFRDRFDTPQGET